jgi:hypothetical protein
MFTLNGKPSKALEEKLQHTKLSSRKLMELMPKYLSSVMAVLSIWQASATA